jgi:hypothetical protein
MKILSLLFLVIVIAGCSDSNNSATSTSAGSSTGDLLGTMQLSDSRGRNMADGSGVTVQVEGTSFSAVSDVNGNWVIHNLPTKTYAITFSKPNFYTRRNPSYTFVAGAPVRYQDYPPYYPGQLISPTLLGELPQFTVSLDAVTMPIKTEKVDSFNRKTFTYTNGKVFAHTSDNVPDTAVIYMYLIISKKPELHIEDSTSYLLMVFATGQTYTTGAGLDLAAELPYLQLQSYGIQPNDIVYFKAYPVIGFPLQFNSITNKNEYIGYGPTASNVLSGTFK